MCASQTDRGKGNSILPTQRLLATQVDLLALECFYVSQSVNISKCCTFRSENDFGDQTSKA